MLGLNGNRDRVGKSVRLMESVPNSYASASVGETGVLTRTFDGYRCIILCYHLSGCVIFAPALVELPYAMR